MVRVNDVYISGIGVSLGESMTSEQAISEGLYSEESRRTSGASETHVAGKVSALTMAVEAAKEALSRAGKDIGDIDVLVHAGNQNQGAGADGVPFYGYVLRELGGNDISATEIRQGCNGFFGTAEAAIGYLTGAAGFTTSLVTAGENFSTPLIDRWNYAPDFILSDAGTAAVLGRGNGFAEIVSFNSSTLPEFEEWFRGNDPLLPQLDLVYRPADMGKRTVEFMAKGISLPEMMERWAKFTLEVTYRTLIEAGINASDIAKVIPSNSDGRQHEQFLLKPLGLSISRSSIEFGRTVGHAGACDHMICLEHLVRSGELSPGDYVLLVSTGPGIIASSMVVKIIEIPTW